MTFPLRRSVDRLLALLGLTALAVAQDAASDVGELTVGHWVELRGEYVAPDTFRAEDVRLVAPDDEEQLIGDVTRVAEDGTWFEVLGQRVRFDEGTEWTDVAFADLGGARVAVEGTYHDPRKFSADEVASRSAGRDRIVGRVDAVRHGAASTELDVMRFRVVLAPAAAYRREVALGPEALGPARAPARSELAALGFAGRDVRDDDDDIVPSLTLSDELSLGVRIEARRTDERELDLDPGDAEDRLDHTLSVRSELRWRPRPGLRGLLGVTNEWRWRDDEEDGRDTRERVRVNEAYLWWSELYGGGLGLQVGRQDFDERREWLWDENLDAVRLRWHGAGLLVELSAATVLADGSAAEEATDYFIAYVTNDDEDAVWGGYVVDKRADLGEADRPFLYGLRAYGEWFEGHDVWAELSALDGYRGTTDLDGFAFDVGTTWSPDVLAPWYVVGGIAHGSGDRDPADGRDGDFQQTGLHDNNGRFGGVTSFRYYGEVFDPDLSNLSILTLGVGRRFGDDVSVDLVYHRYRQDVARAALGESELDATPNGRDRALGDELDLVVGARDVGGRDLDLEVVVGAFWPGEAFDGARSAWLAQVQLRYGL